MRAAVGVAIERVDGGRDGRGTWVVADRCAAAVRGMMRETTATVRVTKDKTGQSCERRP